MSAINTAAIASPAGGPRPLSMHLRSAMNNELGDFPSGRYTHSGTTISSQPSMTAFDALYDPIRSGRMVGGLTYDLYPQVPAFQQQGFDTRHMSPFSVDYHPQGQQAVSIPSQFGNAIGFAPSGLHHASSFHPQTDSGHGGQHSRQMPGDCTQGLQSLSLGQ